MFFLGEPFLPNPAVFPAYLAAVGEYFRQARKLTAEEVLLSFFERALAPATFHIDSVHHVAVYLGDYLREEDFECWLAFLEQTDQVRDIQSGPSYISPRHYGAPGYWINCQMDDAELEMFSCKHVGTWADFDTTERQSRMSHLALSIEDESHVRPVLEFFAHYPEIDLLAFSPADELGHTYGHLLHRPGKRVLELVYPGFV